MKSKKALKSGNRALPSKTKPSRLDEWLVNAGYFPDIESATTAIRLGLVREERSGVAWEKPGARVPRNFKVKLQEESSPYVSRGGEKLASFLRGFSFDVSGKVVLDIGASTGGFTDLVLQRGARHVYAIDVGTHQLHEKIRANSKVEVMEQTDVHDLDLRKFDPAPDLALVDLSFTSIRRIARKLVEELPRTTYIFLVKPQFEVDRFQPKKRGVVSEANRLKCVEEMLQFFGSIGIKPILVKDSALKGVRGNQETFVAATTQIPKHIFRTYDIRAKAEAELTNSAVERIGRAFARRVLQSQPSAKIAIGWDDRPSSPRIRQALIQGVTSIGAEVVELGSVTTPMAYFAHHQFDTDALIQITASHNPKEDNGFKMMIQKNTLFGPEILSLHSEAEAEDLSKHSKNSIRIENRSSEVRKSYIQFLHQNLRLKKKFKMVLDCGNGMAGGIAREVFSSYASDLEILFEKVDCSFPNHEADPTVLANIEPLRKEVLKRRADIGFAFDGDGDRLGVVTAKGRVLFGDEILMLLSELVLARQPGATIIGEVKCSEKLFRMIESKGGKPVMYRTGHSLIKKKMKELQSPIAGEMSGHLFFSDRYFGFDDAVYGAIRVLEVVDELGLDLDEWIGSYPSSFVTPEIRVQCEESEKEVLVEKVKTYFSKLKDAKLSLIDGVRVSFQDGSWALVRASNTQAVLVVRIEAVTELRLQEIAKQISTALGREFHV